MIALKKVTKAFGDIVALKDVSFEVEKGEFVYITGPSGAGKTTLLRMILVEIKPDSGSVIVDGTDTGKVAKKEVPLLRQKIGVVFQDFKILPERTVRENVEVALAVLGVEEDQWKGKVDSVLKMVGLEKRAELFPKQLSGGELQRVSFARALVVNPKIILADEPTGNLDWDTAEALIDLLEMINKEGKTVIMATHHKQIVEKHKHRTIHLEGGKIKGK
ncbi:cell division ATP-binding protein FtsE [Patescibacteria group bacterium]